MLTKITGTGTGSAPVVNLTFPFIDKSHVKATVNGASVTLNWTGASQVTFAAVVLAGQAWAVFRQTPTAPLVDFTNGAVLTEQDLDLAHRQHQYIDEETADNVALNTTAINTNLTTLAALPETIRDTVGATLVAGSNITINADDAADTITITGVSPYSDEMARDAVAAALIAGQNISIQYDDAADKITVNAVLEPSDIQDTMADTLVAGANVTITPNVAAGTITIASTGGGGGGGGSLGDGDYGDVVVGSSGTTMTVQTVGGLAVALAGHGHVIGDITGLQTALDGKANVADVSELARDALGSALVAGTGITITPNDAGDTITIAAATDAEFVRDTIGAALVAGSGISITADDAGDTITIAAGTGGAWAPSFLPVASFSAARTIANGDNNSYLKFTGATGRTLTLNGTPTAGLSVIVANRASANLTLSAASGMYKNGASTTATSGTLAVGGTVTLIHEGAGVWVANGSGLT